MRTFLYLSALISLVFPSESIVKTIDMETIEDIVLKPIVTMSLGSPSQDLKLRLDLTSTQSYVLTTQCKSVVSKGVCTLEKEFDMEKSNSLKIIDDKNIQSVYDPDSVKLDYYTYQDTLCFDSKEFK